MIYLEMNSSVGKEDFLLMDSDSMETVISTSATD
jgi:hypothetical protein